jgi:hypothetical protein
MTTQRHVDVPRQTARPMSLTREALLTLSMCVRYAAVMLGSMAAVLMIIDGLTR